ncbi:hypothetical protein J6590_036035 [Homalodisca vitripennis]|nr:hypothetical protein J6590_036035 [Homalodisca vitripennis]
MPDLMWIGRGETRLRTREGRGAMAGCGVSHLGHEDNLSRTIDHSSSTYGLKVDMQMNSQVPGTPKSLGGRPVVHVESPRRLRPCGEPIYTYSHVDLLGLCPTDYRVGAQNENITMRI